MKQRAIIIIAALTIAGLAAPALCEETAQPASAAPSSVGSRHDDDKDKDKDRDRQEKIRLEREARREAERRDRHERYSDRGDAIDVGDVIGTVINVASDQGGLRQRFAVGVVYAPANAAKMSGVGIQFLNRERKWGASVWLSGALGRDEDVIDTGIPHSDYYLENQRGSYGLQGLYAVGSESASLILGAGFAVEQTMYTAVSNATGWRWNNGSDSRVKFAGQIGCRLRFANRVSLNLGYDTHQSAFFGFTGDF